MINLSALPKIGNMTKGYGLSGIFDASNATTAWFEGNVGYAGVDFSSAPKRIERVEAVSATNGFDGSGLCSGG